MDAPDDAWARRHVEAARVARLGTVDDRGRPRLVPCTFVLDSDTLYSAVDAKPKRTPELARLGDVAARPDAVTVLVDHYDDGDWDALWWVRLRGEARVLREGPERERALDLLAAKYPQYRERRPDGAVLAVEVSEWRGWRAAPEPA